jgi:fatty acid desaturase
MEATVHAQAEPPSEGLERKQLAPLLVKRNGPGLVRITVQLAILAMAAAATLALGTRGDWAFLAPLTVMGLMLATLFPPLHEAGHRTAFASRGLNEAVLWLCALAMLQAPTFFCEFHWQHHRHTQDRALDPEIASAPELLGPWPKDLLRYLVLVCGVPLMLGKAMFTIACAVLPERARAKLFPFIRASRQRRVAWESRVVVLVLAGGVLGGLRLWPGFAALLLAWPIAHLALGFYLMPEHTGLPHDGSQAHRTRSVVSNAVVRWLMWNMPLHAAHHVHPAVPFHAVPRAHHLLAPRLEHESRGYLAFHREALARALGRRAQ